MNSSPPPPPHKKINKNEIKENLTNCNYRKAMPTGFVKKLLIKCW